MKEQTREDPKIVAAAERQMQRWTLAESIADQAQRSFHWDQPHQRIANYVSISREAGAGGGEIAEQVGHKLGWIVLDQNFIDLVAERFHLSRPMLELVDETPANWAYDMIGPWIDPRIIPHEKYVFCLGRIVIAALRRANAVLVGRGAHFLLPRDHGLAVRIIASEKYRLAHVMKGHGFDEGHARRFIAELERGRRDFVMRYFRRDINDPHLFDLVIQADRIGPVVAADLIVDAYHRHFPAPQAVPPPHVAHA